MHKTHPETSIENGESEHHSHKGHGQHTHGHHTHHEEPGPPPSPSSQALANFVPDDNTPSAHHTHLAQIPIPGTSPGLLTGKYSAFILFTFYQYNQRAFAYVQPHLIQRTLTTIQMHQ
jgi:hypothetical protein